ncbi:MAG TPA: class I SAM-dependent methyltransferase [Marmoricola sp.]|nr:class I SAM-dependent methyltransferase [Marmoricola sp.]
MSDGLELWQQVARQTNGEDYAHRFAAHFDELAAGGQDVHGEAAFVAALTAPGVAVLDAGCGTGRIGQRLHELGFDVVGVDVDPAMVAVARERAPDVEWHVADLAALDLGRTFDVVVSGGNVFPFLGLDVLPAAAEAIAEHLVPEGLLVAGFGLDAGHLPPGGPILPLEAYDEACAAAGLTLEARYDGWDSSPWTGAGYHVSVHRSPGLAA